MLNEKPEIKIVFTDLDGTLLTSDRKISKLDYQSLQLLGENKIYRVVATGRSVHSTFRVFENNFPIDFLIFSNGAGVMDWKSKKELYSRFIEKEKVLKIAKLLIDSEVDFMLHDIIPSNHYYRYHQTNKHNPDFYRRNEIYHGYTRPLLTNELMGHASQFIAIIPEGPGRFEHLRKLVYDLVPDITVIRATSPLDDKTIWMEIFPLSVSKGKTADWLCRRLSVNQENTLALGNDYNDIDLLKFCKWSYLVENAPTELTNMYPVTLSNCNNGFSHLLNRFFSFIPLDL